MSEAVPAAPGPRLRRLPYAMVVWPLLIGNTVMLALCLLGFHLLSATRAYVGGESLWSKSRGQAVQHLRAYAATGAPARLAGFRAALETSQGDHEARLELEKPRPDLQRAADAFVRGGNAREDSAGMIDLYRWFGRSDLMADSVAAWRSADALMAQLQEIGRQIEQQVEQGRAGAGKPAMTALLHDLDALEQQLLPHERRFSQALGEASRRAFNLLAGVIGLAALGLTLAAWALARAGLLRQARAEAALAEANQRWQLAAQSDGLGLFEWRQHSERVRLDARACAVYGLASGPAGLEVGRAELRARALPEDQAALLGLLERISQPGELLHHGFRIEVDEDGGGPGTGGRSVRHIELTGTLHGGPAAGPGVGELRMVGIVKDVSAMVRQGQLALDKAAAERSAVARMEFLSRLSHELRTPLNAVLGFSELLLLNPREPLSPQQTPRVQMIADAGHHLLRLVNDILDISAIDSGRFKLSSEPTPLAPVLAAAAALSSAECQDFDIQLELPSLPPGLAVLADRQRLGQVITNLLSNACKYNRRGGRVTVGTQRLGERVQISVADQGLGMGADELSQLFQPFKRLAATAHLPGTGLGLTIVKLLVEQMNGELSVSSQPGLGTTFTVSLPAA